MKRLSTLLFIFVFAGTMAFAQDNTSEVNQSGDHHSTSVAQLGNGSSSDISQHGHANEADVDQQAVTLSFFGNWGLQSSDIKQIGRHNEATVEQTNFLGRSGSATFKQIGK